MSFPVNHNDFSRQDSYITIYLKPASGNPKLAEIYTSKETPIQRIRDLAKKHEFSSMGEPGLIFAGQRMKNSKKLSDYGNPDISKTILVTSHAWQEDLLN